MMVRKDIVSELAAEFNFTTQFAADIVNKYESIICNALISGEDIRLTDFLMFKIKVSGGTYRYSYHAKSKIYVPAKYKLSIKPGGKLKQAIESQRVSKYDQNLPKLNQQEVENDG